MLNYMPIMQYRLDIKGAKRHDIAKMIEDLHDLDWSVIVVNDGGISYQNIGSFVSSIDVSFRRFEKSYRISTVKISTDPHRIMIFKK